MPDTPPEPPPPPMGWGQVPPPPYPSPSSSDTNGFAVASLVVGIAGVVLLVMWPISWVAALLALIFGYLARSQARERGQSGNGMAIAGIVLGWIGLVLPLAAFGFVIFTFMLPG